MTNQKERACSDRNCPIHGTLSVRGQALEGTVASDKMDKTIVITIDSVRKVPKYKRTMKTSYKVKAHNPPCMNAKKGDKVRIMECRRLSATKAFTVIENLTNPVKQEAKEEAGKSAKASKPKKKARKTAKPKKTMEEATPENG